MQVERLVSVEKIIPLIKSFAFVAVILTAVIAFAENPERPGDESEKGGETMTSGLWRRAAGAWRDFHSKLNERGVTLEFNYTGEAFHSFEPQPDGVTRYRGLINLTLSFDTEKSGLWPKGELFIQGQNGHGRGIDINPGGVVQPISNIDARDFTQISEYGLKQDLLNGGVQIILGKKDVNLIFCANEYGGYLVNPSYALIPTVPMPTFPAPALGAAVFAEPVKRFSLGLGFYDGSPKVGGLGVDTLFDGKGGHFSVLEPAWKPSFGSKDRYPGDYRLGFWYHSGRFAETGSSPNPKTFQGNYGFYLLMNQVVYKGKGAVSNGTELGLFFQFGWSPSDRNNVTQYVGAGFKYKGVLNSRPHDILGFATSHSWLMSNHGRTGLANIELFYLLSLTSWMNLQPDIQYFHHPSDDRKNGLSAGLRWIVLF